MACPSPQDQGDGTGTNPNQNEPETHFKEINAQDWFFFFTPEASAYISKQEAYLLLTIDHACHSNRHSTLTSCADDDSQCKNNAESDRETRNHDNFSMLFSASQRHSINGFTKMLCNLTISPSKTSNLYYWNSWVTTCCQFHSSKWDRPLSIETWRR